MKTIEELATEWLLARRNGDIDGIDLPYFLTVPMVEELLSGKNPKKVRNEYLRNQ